MPVLNGLTFTLADGAWETSQTTGTGSYALDGAKVNSGITYRTLLAALGNGVRTLYVARMGTGWEVALGTISSPGTLSRDSILASSNSNNAVSWAAGTKDIQVDISAALANQIAALGAQNWAATFGGTSGGSANAQTVTPSPAISGYVGGLTLAFFPGFTNTAINPTLNANAKGALTMVGPSGEVLGIGDIQQGKLTVVRHSGASFVVQSLPPTLRAASLSGGSQTFTGIRAQATQLVCTWSTLPNTNSTQIRIQIGPSGGVETSGYIAVAGEAGSIVSTGFVIANSTNNAQSQQGQMTITRHTGNTWMASGTTISPSGGMNALVGSKQLAGELDRIAFTVSSGTLSGTFSVLVRSS